MSLEKRTSFTLRSEAAFGNLGNGSQPRNQRSIDPEKAFAGMCAASAPPKSTAARKHGKRQKISAAELEAIENGKVGPMAQAVCERVAENGGASAASSNGASTKVRKSSKVRGPFCVQCFAVLPTEATVGPSPPPAYYAEAVKSSIFARNCPHGPFCHSCRMRIGRRVLPACICRALLRENWRSEWPRPVPVPEGEKAENLDSPAPMETELPSSTQGDASSSACNGPRQAQDKPVFRSVKARGQMKLQGTIVLTSAQEAVDLPEPHDTKLVRLPGYGGQPSKDGASNVAAVRSTSGTAEAVPSQLTKKPAAKPKEEGKASDVVMKVWQGSSAADKQDRKEDSEAKPLTAEELRGVKELRQIRDSLTAEEAQDDSEGISQSAAPSSLSPPRTDPMAAASEPVADSEQAPPGIRSFKRAPRERHKERGKPQVAQDDEEDSTVVTALNPKDAAPRCTKPTFSVQLRQEQTLPEGSGSKRRKTSQGKLGKAPRICVGDEDEQDSS
eukprot:gnl/MRDRNA2_/MRDRNA2_32494_c0_seq1.p1 gnl/MRDRNA2_/MRDRNA2_32494_c0~~gnl/MRDRNA2_/MRDRNA2_32494_c0_seq1.p1  ORF type:complete len:501 (+),score=105.05 gnl/MRDRNA2_/MRDRNA2_32494_c0_seq1:81-1583(+)